MATKGKVIQVQKRDGRIVDFDQLKITKAIHKAITITGQGDGAKAKKLSDKVLNLLIKRFRASETPKVEEIQDIVEEVLILEGYVETARAYILYREQRRRIREAVTSFDESLDMVDKYLQEQDWQVKENANMAYSLQGLNHYITSAVAKKYWLSKIYPKEIREAVNSGDFHIHNLDILAAYCCGWDLYDLLMKGFGGVSGKVESKPARHLCTAFGQLINFFYTLQGEIAGAQAVSSIDTLLAPFIRYDNLNYQQVKQAMQEFLFGCAIPTRVGFQTPFTNITLDIKPSPTFASQPVIIGGLPQKETYGEFQEEMNVFNRAFYEVMMEGDSKGRVFTFPIPTINITPDFDWDNPALEPMWEATAKYGVNYFSNFVNSDMKPEDVRSMCLDANEEILVRNSKQIKRLSIKEVAENYKLEDFDKEGWVDCKEEGRLEVLSLNPKTFQTEWSKVKRFLRALDKEGIEVGLEDGKKAVYSNKHPMAVWTENGIQMKFAKDLKPREYLLCLKKTENSLSQEYQKIGDLIFNEDLAKILGYFTADGNYLFESRKGYTHYGEPRGIQFTFNFKQLENLSSIKNLLKRVFDAKTFEKKDPRYNTYYLYIYNSDLARKLFDAGFQKYGQLPQILFNSPKEVIKAFLDFYFLGDGYKKRLEIHLNDLALSRDLVLLYSLIGQPTTYKLRKNSQRIYLQHSKSKIKKVNGWLNNPIIADRVPGWMAASGKVPGLTKSRMVGFDVLDKYGGQTDETDKIKNSNVFIVRIKTVKKKNFKVLKEFYDLELEKNHLFIHSLGQVSWNCCRLRLDNHELYKRGGGLFGSNPLTGSIGVVTINMPRIGYLAKTKKDFFARLSQMMDLAKESLEIKRKAIENFIEKRLYPYSRYYLDGVKKMRGSYWANHFSTIGLIGMNEALLNFTGKDIGSLQGRNLSIEILDFMRDRLVKYQEETGSLYNLEATPAEGTSYRLAKKDKELYPDIITAGEREPYYTNSTQLSVNYTDDIFEALKLQDEIQCKYTGGTVLHLFVGEKVSDVAAVKSLIKTIFNRFHLPYVTFTPTFSVCPTHGYIAGEHFTCPKCVISQPCEVYSRIVGYLRPVQQWNVGKQEEYKDRLEFAFKPETKKAKQKATV